MTVVGIIVFIFALFALSRVFLRMKDNNISFREGLFWIIVWTTVSVLTIFPQITDKFSKILGIGSGINTAFFIAIILLLYTVFRLYIKIEKLDNDITQLSINTTKELHKIKKTIN